MAITQNSPQSTRDSNPMSVSPVFVLAFGAFTVVGGIFAATFTSRILPQQASAQAQNTDALFTLLLLLGGIVFFLVEGLLLYSVVRFRAKPNDFSDGPAMHGNMTLEIVWTIIPAVVVTVLSILSFVVWTTNNAPRENENMVNGAPIEIIATGQRFAWGFEYRTPIEIPPAEGAPTEATPQLVTIKSNELHTYVGQNVKVDMNTSDVIHSFWVPAMRVKQDLLPGRQTYVRFTPIITAEGFEFTDETTGFGYNRYRLICTELCGGGHGQMYSWLVVHESEEAYLANFYNPAVDRILNPPDDPALRGDLTIAGYACAGCHILSDQEGWVGITGPSLNGIGSRAATRGASLGIPAEEYIAQSVRLPQNYYVPGYNGVVMNQFVPAEGGSGTYMPQTDLIDIIAYLCTQTESGNPAETSCSLAYNEDGSLVDPEAAVQYLTEITSRYE